MNKACGATTLTKCGVKRWKIATKMADRLQQNTVYRGAGDCIQRRKTVNNYHLPVAHYLLAAPKWQ